MANKALLQRELKRAQLAAKFAKKYADLKAHPKMSSCQTKNVMQLASASRICLAMPIQLANATVARSRVVLAVRSVNSVCLAPKFVKWLFAGDIPGDQGQLVSPRRTTNEHGDPIADMLTRIRNAQMVRSLLSACLHPR